MKKIIPLIILILFLIIISTVLFIQNDNLKKEIGLLKNKIADLEKQKPVIITPTPVAKKLPEGWGEYNDDEYKFKIWYPLRLSYAGIPDNVLINVYPHKYKNYIEYIDKKVDAINFSVTTISDDVPSPLMNIYIYNGNVDIKNFISNDVKNDIKQNNKDIQYQAETLTEEQIPPRSNNIVEFLKQKEKNLDYYANQYIDQNTLIMKSRNLDIYRFGKEDFVYYIKRNNQIFIFVAIPLNNDSGQNKTVEQMVQSFQFID